ncbi:FliM/FliN family flagellar motor switch protein [Photobacterium minamisatsumaniensis]|uniref:FliM/FliN family flagellar motor switch protein n=1 Tax=Photobacterium minamisatsumaniensis TaxID=2910233 RepID=UPI003D0EC6FC
MKPSNKKNKIKPRNIHGSTNVFPIDIRSLGRPLNAAQQSLSPYFYQSEKVLEKAINNMTRRTDCSVTLISYGLEVTYHDNQNREPICFNHAQFSGQCLVNISQPLTHLIAEAFYGGTPCFSHIKKDVEKAPDLSDSEEDASLSATIAHMLDDNTQSNAYRPIDSANSDLNAQPMNASEKRVQARIAATLLNQLSHEWQVSPEHGGFKNGVLSAIFSVQIEDAYGEIHLQLDDELLLQLTAKDVIKAPTPSQLNLRREMQLKQVPIRLNAVLSRQTLALDQVMKLKAGDIISTDIQEVVDVHAGTQALYQAHVVERNGHLVLQVVDTITPQERN